MSSVPTRPVTRSMLASRFAVPLLVVSAVLCAPSAEATPYLQTNLVTDDQSVLTGLGYAPAVSVDLDLVNPWGISHTANSPFWISDNGSSKSTLYNGGGTKQGLIVVIPLPTGAPAAPTGQVANSNNSVFSGDRFIFATENGTIAGWNNSLGTTAATRVDSSAAGAIYKGLALDSASSRLYAADFHNGAIDVFDANYVAVNLGAGAFTDPNLPSGFAPFNIQFLDGKLYVTYAKQDATGTDDVAGPGNGYVDVYDTNGVLLQRAISDGPLNSPWGLDIAPSTFGQFGGDLLVGNFGDGTINAFDPITYVFDGTLRDGANNPIAIDGLWGLINGNGGNGGDPNLVYFTAGINEEANGLFGSLAAVPEPGTLALFGFGILGLGIVLRRNRDGNSGTHVR